MIDDWTLLTSSISFLVSFGALFSLMAYIVGSYKSGKMKMEHDLIKSQDIHIRDLQRQLNKQATVIQTMSDKLERSEYEASLCELEIDTKNRSITGQISNYKQLDHYTHRG